MTRKLLLVCFICLLATPAVADTTSPTSGLWSNINTVVLIFTLLLGVAGFIRSIEQNKDSSFRDITSRLCERDSPVVRAGAAGQLPHYFRYRRYYVFWRPYPSQVLHLLLHALKKEEDLDVRQVLFNSLVLITGNRSLRAVAQSAGTDLGRGIDLVRAKLDQLIMDGFDFSGIDLIEASLTKSSLIRARFVGANLWKATLNDSNLAEADFTDAKLWDAKLEHANLQKAKLLTGSDNINAYTSLHEADLLGAEWSSAIDPRAMGAGTF
jgi:hypothetical protein